jgi:hypothetical protein
MAEVLVLVQRAIIIFTERHSAAGGTDHGDFRFEFGIALEEFRHGCDHHVRGPVQARIFAAILAVGEEALIGDLGGGFAAATGDVEAGNGGHAISGIAQGLERLGEAKTQGADDSGGYDSDAVFLTCSVQGVKTRYVTCSSPAIFDCFPNRSTLHNDPERRKQQLGSPPIGTWKAIRGNLMFNSGHQCPGGVFQIRLNGNQIIRGKSPI